MRAFSGRIVIDGDHRRNGSAIIDFNRFPVGGTDVGDARLRDPRAPFGSGRFRTAPAHIVHIRSYVAEDRARGGGERDEYTITSEANRERLNIDWRLDDNGELLELGFLVVGE